MVSEKIIFYLKRYVPSFAIMGIFTWLILLLRKYSAASTPDVRYLNLADAFTIPAVIMLMVGVMVWISTQGMFDILTYGLGRGLGSLVPFLRLEKDERFYDYKQRKQNKRIKGYSFLFISGGIYFIPALVFNILYYTV